MELISLLIIGISLSMDAFSLALCYGILDIDVFKKRVLALTVGFFHFFMPLLGMKLGNIVEHYVFIDMNYAVFIIFMFLGLEMILSAIKKDTNIIFLNGVGIMLFAFTVSIDSFSAGIGIKFISNNYLLCSIVFSITSFIFTYIGLTIGCIVGSKCQNKSKLIGGLLLILFAIKHLFKL